MLSKTLGIVLNTTKFGDKRLFIHILTEAFGTVTYGVTQNQGKKSGKKAALFQPFSILNLDVEHKNNKDIHIIRDVKIHVPLTNLMFDPVKIPISLFLAEFLHRSVKESDSNRSLFEFVMQSIQVLDLSNKGIANFHLVFLFKLTRFLGFYPNTEAYREGMYFDLINGIFVSELPHHNHYLLPIDARVFSLLMRMNYENMHLFSFSRQERVDIIEKIIEYYKLHLSTFSYPRSLEILQSLFD